MPRGREEEIEHLLRRAGCGATQDEIDEFADLGYPRAVDQLVNDDQVDDDVDAHIQKPGYVGVTARGTFSPNTNITDARQRWLFRLVHSRRHLREKMTLFWHNHFATAYTKIAGAAGATAASRMMAAKPSEDPNGVRGQIELLRQYALGNFRDLLIEITKDPAMLFWLDGRTNVRTRPQENYGRELMELFTMGVGFYQESDVYAAARVFTGWNLLRQANGDYFQFYFNAAQHETSAKEFSFPIYSDGNRRIPARAAGDGLQDGIDLINAVARHPETARRLARKLYAFFVSEVEAPDDALVGTLAAEYLASGFEMKPVLRRLFASSQFRDSRNYYARYSWPAEFVVRSIKEVGWTGFSVNDALTPLVNMGQQLFEPPDVAGWELGRGWFSTGAMLARMNFAAQLATNQKFNLRDVARPEARTPEALLSFFLDKLTAPPLDRDVTESLLRYLRSGGAWTASDAQLLQKSPGLAHLLVGSGEYQLM